MLLVASGCAPLLVERSGHRVFNSEYGWLLDAPGRSVWQKPEALLDAAGVEAGTVVADIGAGTGYLTRIASRRVGEEGLVYATDVQVEMIDRLHRVAEASPIANIEVIEGRFERPELPESCCDVVLFVNVYKEIVERVGFLQATREALREEGRVVIAGFHPTAPGPGPPRDIRMSREAVIDEGERAGLRLTESHDFLPLHYLLVFEPIEGEEPPAVRRADLSVEEAR